MTRYSPLSVVGPSLLLTLTKTAVAAPLHHPNYAALPVALIAALTPLTDDQKAKVGEVQDKLKSDIAALHHPGQPETPDQRTQQKTRLRKRPPTFRRC